MSTVTCPHCSQNAAAGPFCEHCGMALPTMAPTSPHVVTDARNIQTSAARDLMTAELTKKIKNASNSLIAVGLLSWLMGGVVYLIMQGTKQPEAVKALQIAIAIQGGMGAAFIGLYFWSRKNPLPATLTGFIIYLTLVIINVVSTAIQRASDKSAGSGIGGFGIGWLDIVILAFLVSGVKASLDCREINRQRNASATPLQ